MAKRDTSHFLDRISNRVDTEIESASDHLATRLESELLDDRSDVGEQEFLRLFREKYTGPHADLQYIEKLRMSMGDESFNAAFAAAFGIPKNELTLARLLAAQSGADEAALPGGAPTPAGPTAVPGVPAGLPSVPSIPPASPEPAAPFPTPAPAAAPEPGTELGALAPQPA